MFFLQIIILNSLSVVFLIICIFLVDNLTPFKTFVLFLLKAFVGTQNQWAQSKLVVVVAVLKTDKNTKLIKATDNKLNDSGNFLREVVEV